MYYSSQPGKMRQIWQKMCSQFAWPGFNRGDHEPNHPGNRCPFFCQCLTKQGECGGCQCKLRASVFCAISGIVSSWIKVWKKFRFYSNMISGQKNGYKSHCWQLTYNGLHCSSLQDSLSCFGRTVICNLHRTWVICNSNACCKLYGLSTPPFTRKDKTHSRDKYHIWKQGQYWDV